MIKINCQLCGVNKYKVTDRSLTNENKSWRTNDTRVKADMLSPHLSTMDEPFVSQIITLYNCISVDGCQFIASVSKYSIHIIEERYRIVNKEYVMTS